MPLSVAGAPTTTDSVEQAPAVPVQASGATPELGKMPVAVASTCLGASRSRPDPLAEAWMADGAPVQSGRWGGIEAQGGR